MEVHIINLDNSVSQIRSIQLMRSLSESSLEM